MCQPLVIDPFFMEDKDSKILELEAKNYQLEQGLMMARAQIESSEMELRAVQIAYCELKKEYEDYKSEIKQEFFDLMVERDLQC